MHRVTEGLELEGTFNDHLVQAPCHEQEYLLLNQVVLSPIQTEHEHFRWWRIRNFSGQHFALSHHPYCTINQLVSNLYLPCLLPIPYIQNENSVRQVPVLISRASHSLKLSIISFPEVQDKKQSVWHQQRSFRLHNPSNYETRYRQPWKVGQLPFTRTLSGRVTHLYRGLAETLPQGKEGMTWLQRPICLSERCCPA